MEDSLGIDSMVRLTQRSWYHNRHCRNLPLGKGLELGMCEAEVNGLIIALVEECFLIAP